MSKSEQLFARASQSIAGGVNSPVRAFRAVGGTPVFFSKAEGPLLFDADGKRYIDYIGSWGPMIAGHANPRVLEAVRDAIENGLSFGAPTAPLSFDGVNTIQLATLGRGSQQNVAN